MKTPKTTPSDPTGALLTSQTIKAIDKLVREGTLEHCMINGKPGVRLVKKEFET